MKRFFQNVDKVLLSSVSLLVFFAYGIMWNTWDITTPIPLWSLYVAVFIFYCTCIVIYAVNKTSKKPVVYKLPEVKSVIHNPELIILIEKNEIFAMHSLVAISFRVEEEEIEHFLGIGYIQTINEQGNMQIVFKKAKTAQYPARIIKNLSNTNRKSIVIRPTISISDLEVLK